jgi:hypothetical protein
MLGGCGGGKVPTKVTPTSTEGLTAQTINLSTGTSMVKGEKWRDVEFTVDSSWKYVSVEGWFHASGGAQNDIEIFICDDSTFSDWESGRKVTPIYNTGRKTIGEIDLSLPEKWIKYHLVFSNIFANTPKYIQSQIDLKYYTVDAATADNSTSN